MKVKSISIGDPGFPPLLRQLHDAPQKIYYLGDLAVLDKVCLGIVGTRRSSAYGESQAFEFARALGERGLCIISGLAFGIDAAAHKGALEGGGATVAVLAQALPNVSPASHVGLAKKIVESGGLLISEKEPGTETFKGDYLTRNRLISGLSKGVLVVEAPYKSGAYNTANHALYQDREVLAIPGRLTDVNSAACNRLLRAGARLVRSPKDVMEDLDLPWDAPSPIELKGAQKTLFELISGEPKSGAELGEAFGGSLRTLYSTLGELELKGLVQRTRELRYAVAPAPHH